MSRPEPADVLLRKSESGLVSLAIGPCGCGYGIECEDGETGQATVARWKSEGATIARVPIAEAKERCVLDCPHEPRYGLLPLSEARAEALRLRQTVRSQKGMLKVQGEEITRLRRQVRGAQGVIASCEKTNGRLAKDLVDAWEFIWRVAGGAIVGANARQIARNYLLNRKSTEADR